MKVNNIFAVSVIAMLSVCSAHAQIASTTYVSDAVHSVDTKLTAGANGYDINAKSLKVQGADVSTFSGSYNDLTSKPTIPTAVSELTNDLGYITSADVPAQVQANWTATTGNGVILNKPTLANVATSGSYNDLSNKPTIPTVPTNVSAFANDAGYITSADVPAQVQANWNETDTSSKAYIANKPTIPAAQVQSDWNAESGMGVILNKPTLATVATSGSYNDLGDKPTIPTVPTDVSAFANDAGYITSADVPAQVQANWTATEGSGVILNKPTLAPVATSGSYSDLLNTPTIPANAADVGAVAANSAITAGTATKITYDDKGLVTAGTTLSASDIPNIAESQVTNLTTDLTNAQNKIPSGSEGASNLASIWVE